ncbi:MAG: hypothetical protein J7515_04340, partial [Caulobacter sp.]|nr:hypothetical protein [Caulobacter sp.]
AAELLDRQLEGLERNVLRHGGGIRHDQAEAWAKAEYKLYDERRRLARREEAHRDFIALRRATRRCRVRMLVESGRRNRKGDNQAPISPHI